MFDRLREDIHCVFERDPAARNSFEVLTTYPGLHAVLLYRLSHRMWQLGIKWPARFISMLARWLTGIEIHPAARIGRRFFIDHGMGVVIGETAEIGDDCTLYHGVTLGGTSWQKGKRHPTLEDNVIIGAGAKVLGPIRIGKGARIGSNAVVLKDLPQDSTAIGVPGHIVRPSTSEDEKRRREIASKIGFDAYGIAPDVPDPVARAINKMLDHIHGLDVRVQELGDAVEKRGAQVEHKPLPELDSCEIDDAATANSSSKEEKAREGDNEKVD